MIINQILFGLLAVAMGTIGLKYNYQLVGITGHVDIFEKVLGPGGTYLGFKLLALVLIIGGFLFMTGLHNPILDILAESVQPFFPKSP